MTFPITRETESESSWGRRTGLCAGLRPAAESGEGVDPSVCCGVRLVGDAHDVLRLDALPAFGPSAHDVLRFGQDDAGLSHVFAHGPGAFAGRHCHVAFLPFGAGGDEPRPHDGWRLEGEGGHEREPAVRVAPAGVAARAHVEEVAGVVRVGRTLPPIAEVDVETRRPGTGGGPVHVREDRVVRVVVRHASLEELVLAAFLVQGLESTEVLPSVVYGGHELPV